MDLRKLTYLEAIHRHGSFTKASEELHVSQPTITSAINSLEREQQVELIIRGPKMLEFTEAGQSLVRWARRIIDDFSQAEREMAAYSEASNTTLRLGISNMVGSWLYTEVYSPFMREYPDSKIIIKEYPWVEICQMVASSQLDMAYTTWEAGFQDEKLELHPYLDSDLFIVLPPGHPLADLERVPVRCLDQQVLSVFAESSLIHKIIAERCEQAGVSPRLISVTQHLSTMLDMIDSGTAIGFVVRDRKSAAFNNSRYILRQLDSPIPLQTGFITRRGASHTKIMRSFSRYVKKHI